MADGLYTNLRFGPFELSSRERALRRDGVMLPLGSRALDILIYLAERPGEVIAKQELLDRVWSDVTVEEGSIWVQVSAIRKALGDGQFGNRYIANIKGRGYSRQLELLALHAVGMAGLVRDLAEVELRDEAGFGAGRSGRRARRQCRRRWPMPASPPSRWNVGIIVPSRRQCGEQKPSSTRSSGIMTAVPDHIDDTPSPIDPQQFVHSASNLFELLRTAKRKLERDREAAKALSATASSNLQSEIERRARTKGVRPGALAGWQMARVRFHRQESAPHYPRQGPQRRTAAGKNYLSNCGIVAIGLTVDARAMGQRSSMMTASD
ncbi:hypothetical protein V1281_004257 [Nitrobacteraceae bacterium AZCC 2161]